MTGLFKYAMMHFIIEKSVEFYVFFDYNQGNAEN